MSHELIIHKKFAHTSNIKILRKSGQKFFHPKILNLKRLFNAVQVQRENLSHFDYFMPHVWKLILVKFVFLC